MTYATLLTAIATYSANGITAGQLGRVAALVEKAKSCLSVQYHIILDIKMENLNDIQILCDLGVYPYAN